MVDFPRPNNLPGPSVLWGRYVENQVRGFGKSVDRYSSSVDNFGRSVGGQLDVLSSKVFDLSGRRMLVTGLGDLTSGTVSVPTSRNSTEFSTSGTFDLPRPDEAPRSALVVVAGTVITSASAGGDREGVARLDLTVLNGSGSGSIRGFHPHLVSSPVGWGDISQTVFMAEVYPGEQFQLEYSFHGALVRYGTSSISSQVRMENISVTTIYGREVHG